MLKVLFAMMVTSCLMTGALAAEQKIAVVNVAKLLEFFPAAIDADAELKTAAAEATAETGKMRDTLIGLREKFIMARDESRIKSLSPTARQKKEKAAEDILMQFKQLEIKLPKILKERKSSLSELRSVKTRSVMAAVSELVGAYAKIEGFDLVIDSTGGPPRGVGVVLYANDKVDITPALIAKFK